MTDPSPRPDPDAAAVARLCSAPLEPVARFAGASNATFLVRLLDRDPPPLPQDRPVDVESLDPADLAVYKPGRGETPLWDFPQGTLHRREIAAYEVSRALGWGLVPATVLRGDAPLGPGSLQRFVAHDPEQHYFRLLEQGQALTELRRMVLFDLVIDNADRKGGHVLRERDTGRIRLVDHGVAFHAQPKLRTVAWDFAGEPVPGDDRTAVAGLADALAGALGATLAGLLAGDELAALSDRVRLVSALDTFPEPVGPRPFPWPLL